MCAGSNCVVELICGWVRGNGSSSPTATRHQQYTGEERFFLRAGHFDEDGLQFLRRRCRRLSFLLRPCALCSQCRGSGILDLRPVQWDGGGAQVEVRFTRILPCSSRGLFQVRVLALVPLLILLVSALSFLMLVVGFLGVIWRLNLLLTFLLSLSIVWFLHVLVPSLPSFVRLGVLLYGHHLVRMSLRVVMLGLVSSAFMVLPFPFQLFLTPLLRSFFALGVQ